ncbi:integumentary mucin C.1-like [Periophthalmus magnuspinnatus]|uniref:integumentary mucin C.1-like n=1 Tax=Periophthalmus magnuspinnatus TaxID=409849 RepID=UPI002436F9E0|nr:integumentary mucin C.1-like [Periophthalmus magnuspinnatus]
MSRRPGRDQEAKTEQTVPEQERGVRSRAGDQELEQTAEPEPGRQQESNEHQKGKPEKACASETDTNWGQLQKFCLDEWDQTPATIKPGSEQLKRQRQDSAPRLSSKTQLQDSAPRLSSKTQLQDSAPRLSSKTQLQDSAQSSALYIILHSSEMKPQMKTLNLLLSLALSLVLCVHTVSGINCRVCSNADCSSLQSTSCETNEICISANLEVTSGNSTTTRIYKGCVDPNLCSGTTTKQFSVNIGTGNVLGRAECCTTNNCNAADAAAPTNPGVGNLTCNTCDPSTNVCETPLMCNSLQTSCIQITVTPSGSNSSTSALGCSSSDLCNSNLTTLSPLLSRFGTLNTAPTCCEANNCNVPLTTVAPNTTTAAPTTTTTTMAPTTTTTTMAPTTTTTTTMAPTTTTTTMAPTTTTTTMAPTTTTTTMAPTTTTTTTMAPTTTTTTMAPTTTTTTTTTATTTTTLAAGATGATSTVSSAVSLTRMTLLSSVFGLILCVLF